MAGIAKLPTLKKTLPLMTLIALDYDWLALECTQRSETPVVAV
jgi:hypothetical protein